MKPAGKLYIVATPIGNWGDITLRALDTLRSVDAVICEELREGSTLLKRLNIEPKELITLNEHNEADQAMQLVIRMHQGESFALISDGGTPVFSDPGAYLIQRASESGLQVVPVPGASSLMAALSVLDYRLGQFVFGGFLDRDPDRRRQELQRLRADGYRPGDIIGKGQKVTLAMNLTLPDEQILRGPVSEVSQQVGKRKAEFILIVDVQNPRKRS